MPDDPTTDLSTLPDLVQARVMLIGAVSSLVRFARSLPEGSIERTAIRTVLGEMANALVTIHPPAEGAVAQAHVMQTLEIRRPPGEDRAPMAGDTVERYADTLARWFLDHGDV